jgi:DNA-binding NarL/FixJ family response regulator
MALENCVLLIERQTLFTPFLVHVLESNGARVITSGPCPHARRLRRLRPRVVCVDVDNLSASPFGGLRNLRRLLPTARIIAYTSRSDASWMALAKTVGADVVLGPESREDDLLAATGAALGHSSQAEYVKRPTICGRRASRPQEPEAPVVRR